jgi:hypothetical protein
VRHRRGMRARGAVLRSRQSRQRGRGTTSAQAAASTSVPAPVDPDHPGRHYADHDPATVVRTVPRREVAGRTRDVNAPTLPPKSLHQPRSCRDRCSNPLLCLDQRTGSSRRGKPRSPRLLSSLPPSHPVSRSSPCGRTDGILPRVSRMSRWLRTFRCIRPLLGKPLRSCSRPRIATPELLRLPLRDVEPELGDEVHRLLLRVGPRARLFHAVAEGDNDLGGGQRASGGRPRDCVHRTHPHQPAAQPIECPHDSPGVVAFVTARRGRGWRLVACRRSESLRTAARA